MYLVIYTDIILLKHWREWNCTKWRK